MPSLDAFGQWARYTTLHALIAFLQDTPASSPERTAAAAYGMALTATLLASKHTCFAEALEVLKQLEATKTAIDTAASYSPPVPKVTECLLEAARNFVDAETIPCTEWPSAEEIAAAVVSEASAWIFTT